MHSSCFPFFTLKDSTIPFQQAACADLYPCDRPRDSKLAQRALDARTAGAGAQSQRQRSTVTFNASNASAAPARSAATVLMDMHRPHAPSGIRNAPTVVKQCLCQPAPPPGTNP